jgi:hypothetical protein
MTVRQLRWSVVGAVGWTVATLCGLAAIAIRVLDPVPVVENPFGLGTAGMVAMVVLGLTWASVGALLMVRRPGNAVGRWVLLVGLGHAVSMLCGAAVSSALARGPSMVAAAQWIGWLGGMMTLLGAGVFYLAVVFPTGRGHTPRWDRATRVVFLTTVLIPIWLATQPGPIHIFHRLENPIGIGPDLRPLLGERIGAVAIAIAALVYAPFVTAAMAARYRAAGPIERLQLRWFVAAIVVTISALALVGVVGLVGNGDPGEAPVVAFGITGTTVPIAIGIAILRHHLYGIDRIISRTLSWTVITGVLVAVFAGGVIALQAVLSGLTQGQTLAVAASTLVAFALFQPLRWRVQRAVDRRFDRARYDGERVVAAFSERLRDDVDLDTLSDEVRLVAGETVRPASSAVWLRNATNRPTSAIS